MDGGCPKRQQHRRSVCNGVPLGGQ